MLLVGQSLVAGRTINLVEHSMQPMTKPNSNTNADFLRGCFKGVKIEAALCISLAMAAKLFSSLCPRVYRSPVSNLVFYESRESEDLAQYIRPAGV